MLSSSSRCHASKCGPESSFLAQRSRIALPPTLALILTFAFASPANSQRVVIHHGAEETRLSLPEHSKMRFDRDGTLFVDRARHGSREKLVELSPRMAQGHTVAVFEEELLRLSLNRPLQIRVIDSEGSTIDYPLTLRTNELIERVGNDDWNLSETQLTLTVDDPSLFDAATIEHELSPQSRYVDLLTERLSNASLAEATFNQERLGVIQAKAEIESSLSDKRYEPTRLYLQAEFTALEQSIAEGNRERAQQQSSKVSKLLKLANRVISFSVQSPTEDVKVELFALLDEAPRKHEYTNGRIRAVVPGKYRLVASKPGWSDSDPLQLDLFREQPSLIQCSMKKPEQGFSVCRISEQ